VNNPMNIGVQSDLNIHYSVDEDVATMDGDVITMDGEKITIQGEDEDA
jgi:hypothetical protein